MKRYTGNEEEPAAAQCGAKKVTAILAMTTAASVAALTAIAVGTHDARTRWIMAGVGVVVLATDAAAILVMRARNRPKL